MQSIPREWRNISRAFTAMGDELWPLVLIGAVTIPLGLWVFRRGEIYAKRHGKLKRSG